MSLSRPDLALVNRTRLWSFTLGRPFRVDSEELSVKPPSGTSLSAPDTWDKYTSASSAMSSGQHGFSTEGGVAGLVAEQWVSLCGQLAPFIRVL